MQQKNSHSMSMAGTVVYGLFIIVPLGIVFLLLVKLTEILEKIAAPLGLESAFGTMVALIIAATGRLLQQVRGGCSQEDSRLSNYRDYHQGIFRGEECISTGDGRDLWARGGGVWFCYGRARERPIVRLRSLNAGVDRG